MNESVVVLASGRLIQVVPGRAAMPLPSTGQYLLRDALAPLQVDRERDVGTMIEANIWVQHR